MGGKWEQKIGIAKVKILQSGRHIHVQIFEDPPLAFLITEQSDEMYLTVTYPR